MPPGKKPETLSQRPPTRPRVCQSTSLALFPVLPGLPASAPGVASDVAESSRSAAESQAEKKLENPTSCWTRFSPKTPLYKRGEFSPHSSRRLLADLEPNAQ